jgi:hypothetical protein
MLKGLPVVLRLSGTSENHKKDNQLRLIRNPLLGLAQQQNATLDH